MSFNPLQLCNSASPMLFSLHPARGKIDTSQAAAASIAAITGAMRQRVLDHVASCGEFGATAVEIQLALGMRPQTCSARCNELLRLGLIERSGQRRPTESGRSAHVYVANGTQAGAADASNENRGDHDA